MNTDCSGDVVTAAGRDKVALKFQSLLPENGFPPGFLERLRDAAGDGALNTIAEELLSVGNTDAAALIYRARLSLPKPAIWAIAGQARIAQRRENWSAALDLWDECLKNPGPESQPFVRLGRAQALLRLGRAGEALTVWREVLSGFPDRENVIANVAVGAAELGQWELLEECATHLLARFPEHAKPEWFAHKAVCLQNTGRVTEIAAVLDEMSERFPQSPVAARLRIGLAIRLYSGLNELLALTENAYREFPDDPLIATEYVRNLLAAGRVDEARQVSANVRTSGREHLALICQWRLQIDCEGDNAFASSAPDAVRGRPWELGPGLALAGFLLELWTRWAAELALELADDLTRRFPGRTSAVCARAKALIALRRDDAATSLIDGIPQACRTTDALELRAWTAGRRNALPTAKQLWGEILSGTYFAAIHRPPPDLKLVHRPPRFAGTGVTIFLNICNERARLLEFLSHYRGLGIRRFVVVDDNSDDGSCELLAEQPDVILYRTADHYRLASSGIRWKNALVERHVREGWCLFADTDELFIFPGWERTPIHDFTRYLDEEAAEGVSAYMLDVYPARLLTPDGDAAPASHYVYCDGDYEWIGQPRPPFRQPIGGIRTRLFGAQEYLVKIPLFKAGCGIHLNSHETTPLRFSGVTGAFLHYKLLSLTEIYVKARAEHRGNIVWSDLGPDSMRRHERYARQFSQLWEKDLTLPGVTETVSDSLRLADRGLLNAPRAYRDWLGNRA